MGDEREGLRKQRRDLLHGYTELEARVGQLTQELGTLEAERTHLRHSILLVVNATHESEMSDKVKGQLRRMLTLTNREQVP